MQVTVKCPAYDASIWNHPWCARVTAWPDKGPPALAFGRRDKTDPNGCTNTIDAEPGDVVRYGQKAKAPGPDGVFLTQHQGWAIVTPGGGVSALDSVDEARAARRRSHPEDATAAPVKTGRSGASKGKRLSAAQVAAIAAKAGGAAAPSASPLAQAQADMARAARARAAHTRVAAAATAQAQAQAQAAAQVPILTPTGYAQLLLQSVGCEGPSRDALAALVEQAHRLTQAEVDARKAQGPNRTQAPAAPAPELAPVLSPAADGPAEPVATPLGPEGFPLF